MNDAPTATHRHSAIAIGGLVLAVVLIVAGPVDLRRAGYSPDEEFTVFAVRGIERSGLPLLPSGLLYDRGLVYSYATWLAGLAGASLLSAGRVVSLVCSVLALVLLGRRVARLGSWLSASFTVGLVASSLPFWVSATTARFYAPFLFAYLLCLDVMASGRLGARGLIGLAAAAAVTRWTHELAFTLAAVPAVAWVVAPPTDRRGWTSACVAVVTGLVVGQLAIFAVHALAPPSNGDVMVRRFFLWQVLNLFEQPPGDLVRLLPGAAIAGVLTAMALGWMRFRQHAWSGVATLVGGLASSLGQLAVGPIATVVALPLVPAPASRALIGTSLVVLAASTAFWTIALLAAGFDRAAAASRLAATAFLYPLDMLAHLVRESPWLTGATLAGLLARAAGRGGEWTWPERSLHALWLGWVIWFGVVESGITVRYLLLPVTFMLTAIAVDVAGLVRSAPAASRLLPVSLAVGLCGVIVVESWRGPAGQSRRWLDARPTLTLSALSGEIQPDDLLVSTDELACVMTGGRIDAWLVLDDFFRERFIVIRSGEATGTYTGAPAESSLGPLLERASRDERRLVVVDVLKDMPGFGSTADLIPRQLAREDLRGDVIAEAPGVRLVHVQPKRVEGQARLQDGARSVRLDSPLTRH